MAHRLWYSSCGDVMDADDFSFTEEAISEVLAEFPQSERAKVDKALQGMRANIADPFGQWRGVDEYIRKLKTEYDETGPALAKAAEQDSLPLVRLQCLVLHFGSRRPITSLMV